MEKFFIGDWVNQFDSKDILEIHEGFETDKYLIIRPNGDNDGNRIQDGSAEIKFFNNELAEFRCKNYLRRSVSGHIRKLLSTNSGMARIEFLGAIFLQQKI